LLTFFRDTPEVPTAEARRVTDLQLTIEKLIYGGEGLARGPAGERGPGKAVFLPFVLPGEHVEARTLDEKPGFLRAWPETVLEPSPQRIEAQCPYFGHCGGCHYQHAGYEYQLQLKATILAETFRRIGRFEVPPIQVHPSPPWHYRNRTRMKVRGEAGSPAQPDNTELGGSSGFSLGYFSFGSHDLLPVEHCPISSPLINRAIDRVWQLGRNRQVSNAVTELEFFVNAADTALLLEILLPGKDNAAFAEPSLLEFVAAVRELAPEICGVTVFRAAQRGPAVREVIPKKLRSLFGAQELRYDIGGYEYRVSAGSFFQTNRYLTNTLVEIVTAGMSGGAALDLYAGAGLFTLPLAKAFREVTAVEAASVSFHDLKRNVPPNVKAFCETTEKFLSRSGEHRKTQFDLVVVDPPRAGLGAKTVAQLGSLQTSRVNYVSCDPATLARDLRVLLAAGLRLERVDLVDLFPQTFHIETVAHLVRS
jgi:23S rRNA (uracil1939-C5)-methyltransferase